MQADILQALMDAPLSVFSVFAHSTNSAVRSLEPVFMQYVPEAV